ncbi:MAG: phytoene desaturase family protein [Candidatus Anstonellales archaeon]
MRVLVIGAGIGGLAAAALLSKRHQVVVIDKNDSWGGRARELYLDGYRFDRGPSWYIMPKLYNNFFRKLGAEDLTLIPLKKSLRVYSSKHKIDLYPNDTLNREVFEILEQGGAQKYDRFMHRSKELYDLAYRFIYEDYAKLNPDILSLVFKNFDVLLKNTDDYVNSVFRSTMARNIMKFHSVFLGDVPWRIPAFYSLLIPSYLSENVLYPKGGMYRIVDNIIRNMNNVIFLGNVKAESLNIQNGLVKNLIATVNSEIQVKFINAQNSNLPEWISIQGNQIRVDADIYIINHRKNILMQNGSEDRAPIGVFLMYLGIDTDNPDLEHHNLYFSSDTEAHYRAIDRSTHIPEDFCFYFHIPSVTDPSAAPRGKHSIMTLVPLPKNIRIDRAKMERKILDKLEELIGDFRLEQKKVLDMEDFENDYLDRSAFGLSHILSQSAMFRPKNYDTKVKNLFYVGQNTNPGIGVPLVLSSAIIVDNIIRERYG